MWIKGCAMFAAGAAALLVAVGGCDDKSDLPSDVANGSRAPHTQRPTTQEILDTPRKALQLGSYPLTIEVPQTLWQIKVPSDNGPVTGCSVEGPAPSGDVRIQVQSFPGLLDSDDGINKAEAKATQEKDQHPNLNLMAQLRPLGDAKVLETRTIIHLAARPDLNFDGADDVAWRLRVFVPHPGKANQSPLYETYVLSFIDLSSAQYDKDHKFLEELVASLKYAPGSDLGL